MTEEFIQKATNIHGDRYDYSKVDYKNNNTDIVITCKEVGHGNFNQKPKTHLRGSGCTKCGKITSSNKRKNNNNKVIERFKNIHGDKYDYSKMVYINLNTDIIIICKEHGEFQQAPHNHYAGQNCPKCSNRYKITHDEFIEKTVSIHGDKYDYSLCKFTRTHNKVIIICNNLDKNGEKHGEFNQVPKEHLSGAGCKKCATEMVHDKQRSNTTEFIEKAKLKHGDKYDYSKVNYLDVKTDVIITCNSCNYTFPQRPNSHLTGAGCQKCNNVYRRTQEDFINDAKMIHGDTYDYSKVIYINVDTNITITCKTHGDFIKTPYRHINRKQGCQRCCLYKKYSKSSILYLNFMSKINNIKIQHAENRNEFCILTTKYKADGYCEETNTIYEFHGTIWHGDPRLCNPNDCNYFGKNYGELYQKTLEREHQIKDLGYNLVIMWEYDWKTINKSIKILQRKFRSNR
jgi:hypothetical protein